MQNSKARSRLKAQRTKFTVELTEGLNKPLRAFVGEMLFAIQPSHAENGPDQRNPPPGRSPAVWAVLWPGDQVMGARKGSY